MPRSICQDLIEARERAKRLGDTAAAADLHRQIVEKQETCEHPEASQRAVVARVPVSYGAMFVKVGDTIHWCLKCSKLLLVEENDVTE